MTITVQHMIVEQTQPLRYKVFEALSDICNITPADARRICEDYTDNGFELPADAWQDEYTEMINSVYDSMQCPDIRLAMLNGDQEVSYSNEEETDPFFGCAKVALKGVDTYLIPYKGTYYCPICSEDVVEDGVQLSCSLKDKGCKSVYCRQCITVWVTQSCCRCPICRSFIEQTPQLTTDTTALTDPAPTPTSRSDRSVSTGSPKKRIIITIRKRE